MVLITGGVLAITSVKFAEVVNAGLLASKTFTVIELLPEAVGVPEITPVEAFMDKPAGKPVADQL